MTRNHLFNILQYVFPLTEDTRQNLLNSVRSSKVIFTAMYFTPGLHPPRLAFRMIRFGSLHVIAFAYLVYYSQKNKACQAPKNRQERRIFSAAPAKEGIGGAYLVRAFPFAASCPSSSEWLPLPQSPSYGDQASHRYYAFWSP